MPSRQKISTNRSSLVVRPATLRDQAAILSIYNDAVRTTTATFDTKPRTRAEQRDWFAHHDARHPVVVAERAGDVVGWASLSPWSERCAYEGTAEISVYVGPSWRGHGVGRSLVQAILAEAARHEFHTLLARVAVGNPISRRLHVSAGFSTVGVMHEVGYKFNRFLDVELLERHIGSAVP